MNTREAATSNPTAIWSMDGTPKLILANGDRVLGVPWLVLRCESIGRPYVPVDAEGLGKPYETVDVEVAELLRPCNGTSVPFAMPFVPQISAGLVAFTKAGPFVRFGEPEASNGVWMTIGLISACQNISSISKTRGICTLRSNPKGFCISCWPNDQKALLKYLILTLGAS